MPRGARLGDTPRARELGAALRESRVARGWSVRYLADLLGTNSARVSRWETGRQPADEVFTATILAKLDVSGSERDRLLALAREVADPNWLAPGVGRQLGALMEYERTSKRITEANLELIPGLLQTAEYARDIMASAGASRGEVEQHVTLRMGRRDILTRSNPVELVALIGEKALRYPPCAEPIMVRQLRHIAEWSTRPNITVQVIPLRSPWTPAHGSAFVLIEFDTVSPVVHLEHYRSSATLTDARDVRAYQGAAEIVRGVAMNPEESAGLIAELITEMEQ